MHWPEAPELKRSYMPRSTKPMNRGKGLSRSKGGLRPIAPKKWAKYRDLRDWVFMVYRDFLIMEGVTDPDLAVECLNCREFFSWSQMTADHVYPRSKHPELTWDPRNLQPMCKVCNRKKDDMIFDCRTGAFMKFRRYYFWRVYRDFDNLGNRWYLKAELKLNDPANPDSEITDYKAGVRLIKRHETKNQALKLLQ